MPLEIEFAGKKFAVERDSRGRFIWPAGLPKHIPARPLTVAENVLAHGVGGLNIDGCRVGDEKREYKGGMGRFNESAQRQGYRPFTAGVPSQSEETFTAVGRWPANIIHDGSDEVLAAFPDAPGQLANVSTSSSSRKTQNVYGEMKRGNGREGEASASRRYTEEGSTNFAALPGQRRNDSGSAARFFKQIEWEDDEWLAQNLQLSFANIVAAASSLQNALDVFVLSGAATWALPAGTQLSASTALSTNATASELKTLCAAAITAIQFIAPRFSLAWPQTRLILSDSPVSVAATREPTGTMTITVDRWKSDGCAAPVTFTITSTLTTEVGGQVSRLKYCAKANKKDRNDGLDDFAAKPSAASEFRPNHTEKAEQGEGGNPYGRWKPLKNNHPTVKPTDLMRYLCRLVTPPGGKVLDPFAGSGSTGRGAVLEGFQFTGIEMSEEYVEIARARIAAARKRYEDEVYA